MILACGHPENRISLTSMDEWPEWILEILISNHEVACHTNIMANTDICILTFVWCRFSHFMLVMQRGGSKNVNLSSLKDVEDFIHNFLIIILEHSMRQKDGWKVNVPFCCLQFTPFYILPSK